MKKEPSRKKEHTFGIRKAQSEVVLVLSLVLSSVVYHQQYYLIQFTKVITVLRGSAEMQLAVLETQPEAKPE